MAIMKNKNGNQYKIQKSQNGGGNNADENFRSWVEQGYIRNTTSYLELFLNTIKIKGFCNSYQYEMQKGWNGGGHNAYKIFMTRWRVIHSKHSILCGTVHEYIENKKMFCNGHQ